MLEPQSHRQEVSGRTVYLGELECFLCGNVAGSIEVDRNPLPPFGIWHPASGSAPQRIADWRSLRCNRCGGALYIESVEALVRTQDSELSRQTPRRGRPPKWLVEQRRKAREAAESRF